ncbi:signal peptide peptidase SppA [Shewanella marina]|uniref:signal peptide peptidase SppA n=1 Tax=Shewanella marina TaxID=487319 RepID=UPI0004712AAC|nr:signal peptide peptidase SppA [Shewanella marina]
MSDKPSFLRRCLSFIWNSINFIRKAFLNLIFFGILIAIVVSVTSEEEISINKGSALVLNLQGKIVDQKRPIDPYSAALSQGKSDPASNEILLSDLIYSIDNAAQDDRIGGIVLQLGELSKVGLANLDSVGRALTAFKTSGKPIIAVGNFYSQTQYYLASFANEIYLNPQGVVALEGLSSYRQFYKSALDKLKIQTHIFRVGTYKSAIEPFIRNDMSAAAKEANITLLDNLWQNYAATIAKNRGLDAANLIPNEQQMLAYLKQANGNTAQMALNLKLVDKLANKIEINNALRQQFGKADGDEIYNHVSYDNYNHLVKPIPSMLPEDSVAVIVAQGTIQGGKKPAGEIGGESTSKLLAEARHDEHVKAVVLRVNSPGGSAFASEQIRQQVLALKAAGKPVVISMGNLAASGGYWISADASYIYAMPSTITGSIGIFGMFATIDESLAELGIHTDGVATSPWAGLSITRALDPAIGQVIQTSVDSGYQEFLKIVAEGRNMTTAQVDKIAQGRVWTGNQALANGLVDALGDEQQAISKAAELAKLDKYDIKLIEQPLSTEEIFIQELFGTAQAYLPQASTTNPVISGMLQQINSAISQINQFDDPQGRYLYCDLCQYQ